MKPVSPVTCDRALRAMLVALAVLSSCEIASQTLRINLSPSLAHSRGVFVIFPVGAEDRLLPGTLVVACPNPVQDRLLERLAGPGLLPGRSCRPYPALLKRIVRVVAPDTYELRGDHPRSIDSRLLGPFRRSQIVATAHPLWVS